jgi:hypothetical protein
MKVKGLDGRTYSWNIQKTTPRQKCSEYHALARSLLKSMFPTEVIIEEVVLPGSGSLTADFYINSLKLLIEVHGEQHYSFCSFFHKTKKDFLAAKARDNKKREWCDNNNIKYIEFPYKENIDEWRSRIINAITT